VIDGEEQREGTGSTELWVTGGDLQALRISGSEMVGARRFERTVALVDVSEGSFYLIDVFRVAGGSEHAWLLHSSFGSVVPRGIDPGPVLRALPLRRFRASPPSPQGWSVEWRLEDRFGYLRSDEEVRLRATCLCEGTQAWLAEAWVSVSGYRNEVAWIPELMLRRSGPAQLRSSFVTLIEPHGGTSAVRSARRLPAPEESVAVEVELADGRRDLILFEDAEAGARGSRRTAGGVTTDAELCFVRFRGDEPHSFELANGSLLGASGLRLNLPARSPYWSGGVGLQSPGRRV